MIRRAVRRRLAHQVDDHGAYIPTRAAIAEACRRIRERGFIDGKGVWHPPWTEFDEAARRECPIERRLGARTERVLPAVALGLGRG